ncbi:hypothetical protein ACT17_23050 [Mycolicibacterium conceptionense]|uniref:Uncharacterized protein n=1 Tax=Mycolicibacterium conceptionense TaxID=451644 RepID=A0A0J8U6A1_9MYCO|nr:hypothetical protein [Mycolicibacterium conceptionense]KMV15970.1 hypothetical protein ACT17_23050 [Mycolicibacterium conceptionense]
MSSPDVPVSAHTLPAPDLFVVCDASVVRKCAAAVALTSDGHSFTRVLAAGRDVHAGESVALASALELAAEMSDRHGGRQVVVFTDQLDVVDNPSLLPEHLLQPLNQRRVVLRWMQAHPRLRPVGDEYGHRDLMDDADSLARSLAAAAAAERLRVTEG